MQASRQLPKYYLYYKRYEACYNNHPTTYQQPADFNYFYEKLNNCTIDSQISYSLSKNKVESAQFCNGLRGDVWQRRTYIRTNFLGYMCVCVCALCHRNSYKSNGWWLRSSLPTFATLQTFCRFHISGNLDRWRNAILAWIGELKLKAWHSNSLSSAFGNFHRKCWSAKDTERRVCFLILFFLGGATGV